MNKQLLLLAFASIFISQIGAQNTGVFFKAVTTDQVSLPENTRRGAFPHKFDTYQLDYAGIKAALTHAPREFTAAAKVSRCIVPVPLGDGTTEDFAITEIAQLDAEATLAFPDIHCYTGVSTKDPRRTVRISTTVRGFRAMVLQPDYNVAFVEPIAWGQTQYYIAYDRRDAVENGLEKLRTGVKEDGKVWFGASEEMYTPPVEYRGVEVDPIRMKIYRFCVATTGEFAQDHGTTKAEVFAAVTEYTNFISAIYERDMTMRLQLTNASQNVVFLNPATDPYTGNLVEDWMGQNPAVLSTYCNNTSFDVGHVCARYITGGAIGVAGAIGNGCLALKAEGCSAGNGIGDYGNRFLYVIGQEVGHQLGGGHTWNRCGGGGGRNSDAAFEPGSGSTIMSYAGACGSDNVQGGGDLYFHAGSIGQIKQYYTFGGTCGSYLQTTNHAPEVTLPYQDNFHIPISTPFELNGSATDVDGDQLTFCWEEIDAGPETPLGQPVGNAAIFRTRPPSDATNRYLPRLVTILNNGSDITEQLPTYTRDLTFRFTARDNKLNGGGTTFADVAFKAYEGAGPFLVSSPNVASDTWNVGDYKEVTWDVANTNAAPVNCQKVNIRLSTDGGQTYPITLAADVDNDGSQFVQVPNTTGSAMRVRVDAADNIFFDISNANFTIQEPTQPSLTLGLSTNSATVCLPDVFTTNILSNGALGFSDPVNLELLGSLPPGASASFSNNSITPGQSSAFSVDLSNVSVEGIFTFTVRATSGALEFLHPITLLLRRNDFTGFNLQTPANGQTNADVAQTLRWGRGLDADAYDVEISLSPSFNTVLASRSATALDSFRINFLLQKGTAYYWRVRSINECGKHAWSEPYFFSTYVEDCRTVASNDLPKNLSGSSTPTVESKITINEGGIISDVNIKQIDGLHTFFKDLEAHLISPAGTDVLLWKDKCGNFNGSFNFGLDDAAPGAFPCPPNNSGGVFKPVGALAPLIGQTSTGVWTLRVKDNVIGSGGTLEAFQMEFCASLAVTPPFLVNNNVMPLPSGTNRVITPDFLLVEDVDNTPAELIFTVITVPEHGFIERLNIGTLQPGDQFTQADLDAGEIRFFDNGTSAEPDGFRFMVTDNEGGFFGTPKFIAQPLVGTNEPKQLAINFMLFPNPAVETVQLAFGQALASTTQVQLFDLAGRQMNHWTMNSGESSLALKVNNLPNGIYFVAIQNESGSGLQKLAVAK